MHVTNSRPHAPGKQTETGQQKQSGHQQWGTNKTRMNKRNCYWQRGKQWGEKDVKISNMSSDSETSDGSFSQKTDIWGKYGFILTHIIYHNAQPECSSHTGGICREVERLSATKSSAEQPHHDLNTLDTIPDQVISNFRETYRGKRKETHPQGGSYAGLQRPRLHTAALGAGRRDAWWTAKTNSHLHTHTHTTHPSLGAMKTLKHTYTLIKTHQPQPKVLLHFTIKESAMDPLT